MKHESNATFFKAFVLIVLTGHLRPQRVQGRALAFFGGIDLTLGSLALKGGASARRGEFLVAPFIILTLAAPSSLGVDLGCGSGLPQVECSPPCGVCMSAWRVIPARRI